MSTTTHQGAVGAETMTAGLNERCSYCGLLPTPASEFGCVLNSCPRRAALASPRADSGERTAGAGISLAALQAAHVARQAEWCPDQLPDLSFRGNELAGEAGETSEALILHAAEISKLAGRASNIVKKLERERHGWRGSRATKEDLAAELADLIHCAVLCAITADIDAAQAVVEKFNATSEKQGLSVFLPLPATPAQPAGAVPDGLRALSEDYARKLDARRVATGAYNAAYDAILKTGRDPKPDELRAERSASAHAEEALTVATIALLGACLDFASHPAGQSAGSGAEGWRERAATEIDAIAQQWGTEGDADGRAYAKTLAAILRAEQSAPPSSSGQGGR